MTQTTPIDAASGNDPPAWWPSLPDEAHRLLETLGANLEVIGQSAGGRPIIAAALGEPDPLPDRTSVSLASARAARAPRAFYGHGKRQRQHVLFLGAVHGTEFEGTVAMLNVLHAMALGRDLRGRPWPELHAMKDRIRIMAVPFLNMDGRMRYADVRHFSPFDRAQYNRITMGLMRDGDVPKWPDVKRFQPQPLDQVAQLGSYFNDAGINLVYDDFFGDPQPETRAMMALCRREMPDVIIQSHANHGSLVEHAVSYIPRDYQLRLAQLSGAVSTRCAREGLSRRMVASPEPYCGQVFYQSDALHHHCGALPVLMEFPCGEPAPPGTLDEILDVSMTALAELLTFGAFHGFRPPHD
jgi:hypothetical protein